jgi:Rieske Fe-S protein
MSEQAPAAATARDSRRSVLDWLLGASGLAAVWAVAYPLLRYVLPPPRAKGRAKGAVLAGRVSQLPLNSGLVFALGTKPAILIHTPDGEWRAFSARCTHLSCTVRYREDGGTLWCPCHDGRFDLSGKNIGGPPPRPLAAHLVVVKGDEVYVTEGEVG